MTSGPNAIAPVVHRPVAADIFQVQCGTRSESRWRRMATRAHRRSIRHAELGCITKGREVYLDGKIVVAAYLLCKGDL